LYIYFYYKSAVFYLITQINKNNFSNYIFKNIVMKKLKIHNTAKTPFVNFDYDLGLIELKGRSLIENTAQFYERPLAWINEYVKNPCEKTTVNIALDYYNTSSQLWIFQLFHVLTDLFSLEKNITVNWYYQDDDMCEAGADFSKLLDIPINLIESKEVFKI